MHVLCHCFKCGQVTKYNLNIRFVKVLSFVQAALARFADTKRSSIFNGRVDLAVTLLTYFAKSIVRI
jgi:hypothetical protein